jgi:hypothetical protein
LLYATKPAYRQWAIGRSRLLSPEGQGRTAIPSGVDEGTPATRFGSRDFTRCRGWFRGGRKRPRCEFSRRSAQIFVRLRRSTPSRDADGSALSRPCLSWIRHHHRRLVHGNSRDEETSHPVNQERLGLKDRRVTPKSHRDPIGTLILGCAVSPMSPRQFKRRSADHDRPSTGSGGRKKETQAMQQPLLSASVLRDDTRHDRGQRHAGISS